MRRGRGQPLRPRRPDDHPHRSGPDRIPRENAGSAGGPIKSPAEDRIRVPTCEERALMSERARRHDEIRGASVLLTGWSEGREDEVAEALDTISTEPIDLDRVEFPIVALAKASLEKAEAARELEARLVVLSAVSVDRVEPVLPELEKLARDRTVAVGGGAASEPGLEGTEALTLGADLFAEARRLSATAA